MKKHVGEASIRFSEPVYITETASTVGPKEGEGPLAEYFDVVLEDVMNGKDSWEKAESKIAEDNMKLVIEKAKMAVSDVHFIVAGDLLNQTTASTYGVRDFRRPFFGVYGACSSIGEAMAFSAILVDGGFGKNILCGASSHFCTAEKQFRSPLELGGQRTPTASWTVTGDGAMMISSYSKEKKPCITGATIGRIVDLGVKDANNMGAAMAPSAADTILNHFRDFERGPEYYDLIITGDLGYVGKDLFLTLTREKGFFIKDNYSDCGIEIFDREKQDTHNGGSGCACAAVTFSGYIYRKMLEKKLNKVLFIPTGSLQSPISVLQGESIPGIAHAICIENI